MKEIRFVITKSIEEDYWLDFIYLRVLYTYDYQGNPRQHIYFNTADHRYI